MSNQSLFGLKGDQFWADPIPYAPDVHSRLMAQDFQGVMIDAPVRIPGERDSIPLLMYRAGSDRDLWEHDFQTHGIIALMDLNRNRLLINYALAQPEEPVDRPGYPVDAPSVYTGSMRIIDLRERLALARDPAEYLVTVILQDRASNRVRITVDGGAIGSGEATATGLPPAQGISPLPVVLEGDISDSGTVAGAPAVPERAGVRLDAAAEISLKNDTDVVIRGSFRLSANSIAGNKAVGITLLAVGESEPLPVALRLEVPASANDGLSGQFALESRSVRQFFRWPQRYFVYAFAGPEMAGPLSVTVAAGP